MNEFITIVKKMREAQKNYFRFRKYATGAEAGKQIKDALEESKRAEKVVDNMIVSFESKQEKLF